MNFNYNYKEEYNRLLSNGYAKNLVIPELLNESDYTIIIVETRKLSHLEFVIRYSLNKLENNFWAVNIYCNLNNYDFIYKMAKGISNKINIFILDMEIKQVSDYNKLLLKKTFWKYIKAKKVLILQEDSLIFRKGIEEYLKYDFIGAPWANGHGKKSTLGFGNGGFSIRNVKLSYNLLHSKYKDKINLKKKINEDIYFSNAFDKFFNENLPTLEIAKSFSIEHIISDNPIGGHQYWICGYIPEFN
jgi:hypothetical protein